MAFVLDASVAACWAFRDEAHPLAESALLLAKTDEMVVPGLWWFEIRNILVVNERRKRIAEKETRAFLTAISKLRIRNDRTPDEAALLGLARKHGLTVYDAAYLELAQRRRIPLATLDAALAAATRKEGGEIAGA